MVWISEIVQKALDTGYISIAKVKRLQQLVEIGYEEEDAIALMKLHQAVVTKQVVEEPAKKNAPSQSSKRNFVKMKLVCQTAFTSVMVATVILAQPKNIREAVISPDINSATSIIRDEF